MSIYNITICHKAVIIIHFVSFFTALYVIYHYILIYLISVCIIGLTGLNHLIFTLDADNIMFVLKLSISLLIVLAWLKP